MNSNDEIQLHRIFGKVLSDEELARAIELRDKIRAAVRQKDGEGVEEGQERRCRTDIFSLESQTFRMTKPNKRPLMRWILPNPNSQTSLISKKEIH